MAAKRVLILMGSDSDYDAMKRAAKALEGMQIEYDMHVASAHRSPQRVAQLTDGARQKGYGVIIAGAGMAAHLAGVVASHCTLPVIGVPLAAGTLGGTDALLATAQMPPGIPVATVGIGPAGATNAGLLAAAILSVGDDELSERLDAYRVEMAAKIEAKDAELQKKLS